MGMDGDVGAWAERTFGSVGLGDRRRTRRLVHSAAAIARRPEKSFTQVFDWNGLRGFYRLCHHPHATAATLMGPHWEQTRQAMSRRPLVLILHDTTELDFTTHRKLEGAGRIGNQWGRGFFQHNSLAVVPQPREVLGLAYQQWKVRGDVPKGQTSAQRKKRTRQSQWWSDGFRAIGRPPDGSCWVDVCDRGGDDYEGMRASLEAGHHFLMRASANRLVFLTPEHDRQGYLLEFARSLPGRGDDVVEIPARGGRPARAAKVKLAGAPVWVPAPDGTLRRREQPILAVWVVRIWEPNPPADAEALEWNLVCSLPTTKPAELRERRDWYGRRWMVEEFHHVEKSGCREEERRFETADRMEACLAVLSVVAVRVYQMRLSLETEPDAPAARVATKREVEVVRRLQRSPRGRFTVRDFVRGVAKLGGFLGRKGDGEPGVGALWRGYQRLQDMTDILNLLDPPTDDSS